MEQFIPLALFIIQEAIRLEPVLAEDLRKLFAGGIPSPDDWIALRATVAAPFAVLAPNAEAAIEAATPPASVVPEPVPVVVVLPPPAELAGNPASNPPAVPVAAPVESIAATESVDANGQKWVTTPAGQFRVS